MFQQEGSNYREWFQLEDGFHLEGWAPSRGKGVSTRGRVPNRGMGCQLEGGGSNYREEVPTRGKGPNWRCSN